MPVLQVQTLIITRMSCFPEFLPVGQKFTHCHFLLGMGRKLLVLAVGNGNSYLSLKTKGAST